MSQTFKQKIVVKALVAALGFGGVMASQVAGANSFDASTIESITAVNVLAGGAEVTTSLITINEVGQWANGKVSFTLPAGVLLSNGGTEIDLSAATSSVPVDVTTAVTSIALAGAAGVTAPDKAYAYKDSSGNTRVMLTKTNAATNFTTETTLAPNTNVLSFKLKVKAVGSLAAGDINLSITDGDFASPAASLVGLTPVSVKIGAVVVNPIVATAATATTVILGQTNQTPAAITLKLATDYAEGTLNGKTVDIALNNGAAFSAGPGTVLTIASTGGSVPATATLLSSTTARITFTDGAADGAYAYGDKVVISGSYLNVTNATAGAITATITSTGATAIDNFGTSTVTLANAIASGTTVAYNDNNSDGKKATLYFGRNGATAVPADGVKLTEATPASLVGGGTITLALSNGAKFVTGQVPTATLTGTSLALGAATLNADNTLATFVVTTASSTAGTVTVTVPQVDLSSVTSGTDLTLTVGGTAGASGSASIATLSTTGAASVSGAAPVLTYGSTVTLPDVVITEAKVGAFAGSDVSLVLPTGVTFDDITGATTVVTGGVTAATLAKIAAATVTDSGLTVSLTGTSTATTGPSTITIKGLKVKAAASNATPAPSAGDVVVQIAGSATPTGAGDLSNAAKFGGNVGAFLNKQTLKVATIPNATAAVIPAATVTGAITSQTIAGTATATGNDQGKPGTVYVAAIIGGSVFFRDAAGTWSLYDTTKPVPYYATTTLASFNYNVISATDLTALVGAQVVVGYGIGLPGLGNPFKDMIDNAKYGVVYTVAK